MEVTIKERRFNIAKLDAFQQFRILKRLTPLLGVATSAMADISKGVDDPMEAFIKALGPLSNAFAKMPDEDSDYIIAKCLTVVTMYDGTGWIPIINPQGGIQFSFLVGSELDFLFDITIAVIQDSLGSFFASKLQEYLPDLKLTKKPAASEQ